MPLVSILTTEYAPSARYVEETVRAVEQLKLPDGWELEWVVQEDGAAPSLGDRYGAVPFARYEANGAQLGIAGTRNLGLSRVSGDLVQVLDHDDVPLPHSLATMIPPFDDPSVHWAVGQADDLLPGGAREPWDSALPYGMVAPGVANDWAIGHAGNWPVHCAGLMVRTATLRAVGGWAGIPCDDDVAMFAGLSEVTAGWNEPAVTWLYRQHATQVHRSGRWTSRAAEGRRIALERVAALRASGLSRAGSRPAFDPAAVVGPVHPDKDRYAV
ncbi:MAG TPA: glycosyltransferase family 2 protein [Actinocatenispora sp.]